MNIRLATLQDAAALAAIEQLQPFAAGWGEAGFSSELTQKAAVIWCAEQQGAIRGFLALRYAAGQSEILNVAVDPSYLRQGIGKTLLAQALADLKQHGVEKVSLEAAEQNQAAGCLYKQAGFSVWGRRKDFYGVGQDALIWGKTLL